ncbi:MAG: hypothetical protein C0403_05470 [Desulfobacterium sp.]|nr:hypothetical protein [Desulfobacterium sp.]
MKKFYVLICFFYILSGNAFSKDPMKIVYFDNFQPFSWQENHKMQGILIDVLNEALQKRMGIPLIHEGFPWERAQLLVKKNEADAFATVPTPARLEYTVVCKEPVINSTFTLFVNKNNPRINELKAVKNLSELNKFKLGHYIGSGWAKKNLDKMDIYWCGKLDQTIEMLSRNRIDAFIDVSQVVRYNVKKLKHEDVIIELPTIFDKSPFCLCIGKKSGYSNILNKFDETMKKMEADGTLEKIYQKYK